MKIEEEIKTRFKSPYQKAIINIIYTANWLNYSIDKRLKEKGITHAQYNVLRILRGKYPEVCNAGEVKAVMLDKTPDLTRLIDRLLKKGLVERNQCPVNRRKVELKITRKGLDLLEVTDPIIEEETEKKRSITDEESEVLSDILDKFRNKNNNK